jgi:DNA-binding XRE family transcriptional regulator
MNYALWVAIRRNGLRQKDFAKIVGDHESVVSRIINGTWHPDAMRKMKYARALKTKPEAIFLNGENNQ